MPNNNFIIAIDGYSSCGKSTIAKALAEKLNFTYIDSGAMYRAVALYLIKHNINLNNLEEIKLALPNINIQLDKSTIILNNEDVSDEIRTLKVANIVSTVAAIKEVRDAMTALQKEMGKTKDIIMDGRDIGSTVFPNAKLKLFMTADPKIRAERRFNELVAKGEQITIQDVLENIEKRDYEDTNRKESPLIKADDAIVIDNSNITTEQQLQLAIDLYYQKTK